MNDDTMKRLLISVGKAIFVKYYDVFTSHMSHSDMAQILRDETTYTDKSCHSRTSHSRRIIREGCGEKALRIIANSPRVEYQYRTKASDILNRV